MSANFPAGRSAAVGPPFGVRDLPVDVGLLAPGRGLAALRSFVQPAQPGTLPVVGRALAFVRAPLSFVRYFFAIVRDSIPLIGDSIPLIGEPVPSTGHPLAPFDRGLALVERLLALVERLTPAFKLFGRVGAVISDHGGSLTPRPSGRAGRLGLPPQGASRHRAPVVALGRESLRRPEIR